MTRGQKIIKNLALVFAFALILNIFSGITKGIWLTARALGAEGSKENENYLEEITSDLTNDKIATLKIDLQCADLKIIKGDFLKAESNSSNISCKQNGNQLIVKEKRKSWLKYIGVSKNKANQVVVSIPEHLVLDAVKIDAGAGEVRIEDLCTKKLHFHMGAGEVEMEGLEVSEKAVLDGGVGEITIENASVHDMELSMGVGEVKFSGELLGKTKIDGGIGEIHLDLSQKAGADKYCIDVSKGIGDIRIDGVSAVNNTKYGNGKNRIDIDGGIGEIDVRVK